jgi:hypothetical protein
VSRVKPGRCARARGCSAIAWLSHWAAGAQHSGNIRRMSTDQGAQGGAVPPEAASGSDGNATASPSASPDQIYEEVMIRLAVLGDEWQKARDALLGG